MKEYQVWRLVEGEWQPEPGPRKASGRKALVKKLRQEKDARLFKVRAL